MFTSVAALLLVTAVGTQGLAIKARDTCSNWACPATDTAGEAVYASVVDNGVLVCTYDYYAVPGGYTAGTVCNYVPSTGAYYAGYGNCPATASAVYSCPTEDTAGEAIYAAVDDNGILVCTYDYYAIPGGYTAGTVCNYEASTGAYYAGYGNCPSTASC
ncbi:hypothetical protein CALCODRAFT_503965 [Calocera cornea HHB12733]|uniref:Uncharacterized protein n=1 Tax=Calocera cornea HHB12733 TaxID=1353952 RepID=A0A165CNG0_9BASI|nr:hypothetical protein CALCODRAFT_503965 [Calocera cornea HHB12733]